MSRIKSCAVRASYPKLFEPEIAKRDNGKTASVYSVVLLVEDTPEGKAFLVEAQKLADEAGRAVFKDYDTIKDSPTFKKAIRYDVAKYKEITEPHKIIAFVNARSYDTPPGVVSIYAGPDGKPAKVTDPSLIYPGAYIKATLHAYGYNQEKSKGVALGLGNVQVLTHLGGKRIDSRVAAEDDFDADPQAAADLSDL
jgi:hypothetical protein